MTALVSAYNEQHLTANSLGRLAVLEGSPHLERVRVMFVDNSSRDGTPATLAVFARERGIEHMDDHVGAPRNIRTALAENVRAVVPVPNGPWDFGSLDDVLAHKWRYTETTLRRAAEEAGFTVTGIVRSNGVSSLPWFLNGRMLRKKSFGSSRFALSTGSSPSPRSSTASFPFLHFSLIAVMEPRNGG
jgi:hypothetical protein